MATFFDSLKDQFRQGSMVLRLIYINVGIFLAMALVSVIGDLMTQPALWNSMWYYLGAHTDIKTLFTHPWTVITYMFVHGDFWHIFSNMLMLFYVGRILEEYLGAKKILSIYTIGGLMGVALQVLAKHVFPVFEAVPDFPIIGASGAVMAIAVAVVTYVPQLDVNLFGLLRVKLIWIVGIYLLQDVLYMGKLDSVAHFAHLGGALWGFLMIYNYKKGRDWGAWFDRFISFFATLTQPRNKMKVVYRSSNRGKRKKASTPSKPSRDDYEFNAQKQTEQEQLDAILDKIKYKGYEGLTKREKDFLSRF